MTAADSGIVLEMHQAFLLRPWVITILIHELTGLPTATWYARDPSEIGIRTIRCRPRLQSHVTPYYQSRDHPLVPFPAAATPPFPPGTPALLLEFTVHYRLRHWPQPQGSRSSSVHDTRTPMSSAEAASRFCGYPGPLLSWEMSEYEYPSDRSNNSERSLTLAPTGHGCLTEFPLSSVRPDHRRRRRAPTSTSI
jgi:hypothetical protein